MDAKWMPLSGHLASTPVHTETGTPTGREPDGLFEDLTGYPPCGHWRLQFVAVEGAHALVIAFANLVKSGDQFSTDQLNAPLEQAGLLQ